MATPKHVLKLAQKAYDCVIESYNTQSTNDLFKHTTVELIKREEGYRDTPYYCTNGFLTVGYGRRTSSMESTNEVLEGEFVNSEFDRLDSVLNNKLSDYSTYPNNVKTVLISMAYQMGVRGLLKFPKFLRLLQARSWYKASVEMLDSKWARSDSPARAKRASALISRL